ncbi:uncharacterized protein LOC132919948 [Rhopalosiphum padi]|uniref:uncharacterized protein LOC132919948 n=1 Tax=Rhopalosiphum padi TaxID=40932 RepID=UPI00298D63F2|nr:uncharacterized protein LOC132919948 [Rhopalosiphum padi]
MSVAAQGKGEPGGRPGRLQNRGAGSAFRPKHGGVNPQYAVLERHSAITRSSPVVGAIQSSFVCGTIAAVLHQSASSVGEPRRAVARIINAGFVGRRCRRHHGLFHEKAV